MHGVPGVEVVAGAARPFVDVPWLAAAAARGAAALSGVRSVAEVVAEGLGVPEGRAQAIVGQWMREGVLALASAPNPAGASTRTRQGVRVQPDPAEWPGIAQRLCGS